MQPRRISKAKSPIKSHSHTEKSFANHRSQNYYDATNFLWVETSAFILSKTDGQVPGHESSCLQCHCFLPWTCSARVPTTSDMGQTVKLQSHFKSTKKESNIVQPLKNRKLYSRSGSKMVKQNPEEPRGTTSVLPQLWHRRSTSLSLLAVRAPLTAEKWGLGPSRAHWEVERSGTKMDFLKFYFLESVPVHPFL